MADTDSTGARGAPTSRAEAQRLGLKRYRTGSHCINGHVADRLTVNGSCCECARIARAQRYRDNPAPDLARQKAYRASRPDYAEQRRLKMHELHPERAARAEYLEAEAIVRGKAQVGGERTYLSNRRCASGHEPIRFTGDRKCVECNRLACHARMPEAVRAASEKLAQQRAELKAQRSATYRKITAARQSAFDSGSVTYQGRACPYGHDGVRRTKSGTCIGCEKDESASDAKKAYDKAYQAEHGDRIKARQRAYHATIPAGVKNAQAREWAKKNPERRKAISMANKARRRQQTDGGDSTAALFAWEQRSPKVCHWCSVKCADKYHVDHYQPLSKGGMHVVSNLVIACPPCNLRKNAKDPFEFANQMGRLF